MSTKDEMVSAMEDVARRERSRQSRRAIKIVAALAAFGLLMVALNIWITANSH